LSRRTSSCLRRDSRYIVGGLENVVRAFWALLLGQNFGKMMVREAREG